MKDCGAVWGRALASPRGVKVRSVPVLGKTPAQQAFADRMALYAWRWRKRRAQAPSPILEDSYVIQIEEEADGAYIYIIPAYLGRPQEEVTEL